MADSGGGRLDRRAGEGRIDGRTDTLAVLRIADVSGSSPGGMNRYMLESSRELALHGCHAEHLFAEELGPGRLPATIRRIATPWLACVRVLRRVRRGQPLDVVELHEAIASAYCLLRWLRTPRSLPPVVVISYGPEERGWRAQRDRWRILGVRAPLKSRISVPLTRVLPARYALRRADHVIVPSTADRAWVTGQLGVPPARVTCAHTGVAPKFMRVPRREYDGQALRLMFVGTWIDRKGPRELVAAMRRVWSSRPDVSLTLLGTGVGETAVAACFGDVSAGRVRVRERFEEAELLDELARHDAFVLPSWFEGMPLSLLEAAAAGLPCIVSAVSGNVDFIRPDDPQRDGGLLVSPHDPASFAKAIERLAADPCLVARLGDNARRRASQFSWSHNAVDTLRAYRSAAATERSVP